MRFDQEFIEKVREANNIVDIIGQHTTLKGRGDQYMGLCPFPDHKESTPSFSVSESKQLYHCFGCKKSGNIFTFLETFNGFSFVESVEFLARRAGLELPKKTEKFRQKRPQEDKSILYRINRFAAAFYFQKMQNLEDSHPAKSYLQKRGLPVELCSEFRLGYASEAWDELTKSFAAKKVPMSQAEKLGIVRKNQRGGLFDLFRDRLMFPIFSLNDEVVGFGGRILDKGQPKYINSVESPVFKKGKILYGLNKSAREIRSQDRVFVVEGYMDYLSLYAKGIKNCAATLGTALTLDHVKLLKRWTKNIILIFDGDQAGQLAAERSLQTFFQAGLSPQILVLPEGQDPDDFVRDQGAEAFVTKADQSEDLFLVVLDRWMKGYRGLAKDKIQLVDRLKPLFADLADLRLKQIYLDEVSRRIDEDPQRVDTWLRSRSTRPVDVKSTPTQPPERAQYSRMGLQKAPKDELLVLGLSIKSPNLLDFLVSEQALDYLTHGEVREIFSDVLRKHGQSPEAFDKLANLVVSRVKDPEKIAELVNISSPFEEGEDDERVMKECLFRLKDRYLQRQAAVLAAEIKNQPTNEKLEQIMNIQKNRLALKKLKESSPGE